LVSWFIRGRRGFLPQQFNREIKMKYADREFGKRKVIKISFYFYDDEIHRALKKQFNNKLAYLSSSKDLTPKSYFISQNAGTELERFEEVKPPLRRVEIKLDLYVFPNIPIS